MERKNRDAILHQQDEGGQVQTSVKVGKLDLLSMLCNSRKPHNKGARPPCRERSPAAVPSRRSSATSKVQGCDGGSTMSAFLPPHSQQQMHAQHFAVHPHSQQQMHAQHFAVRSSSILTRPPKEDTAASSCVQQQVCSFVREVPLLTVSILRQKHTRLKALSLFSSLRTAKTDKGPQSTHRISTLISFMSNQESSSNSSSKMDTTLACSHHRSMVKRPFPRLWLQRRMLISCFWLMCTRTRATRSATKR